MSRNIEDIKYDTERDFGKILRYGVLWHLMSTYVNLWQLIASYGNLWHHMATYGSLWQLLATYGILWQHMTSYGSLWQFMATYVILYMVTDGNLWQDFQDFWHLIYKSAVLPPSLMPFFDTHFIFLIVQFVFCSLLGIHCVQGNFTWVKPVNRQYFETQRLGQLLTEVFGNRSLSSSAFL